MSTLFEQDKALANTLASTLLIPTLESCQVSPLLGLELPAMVDLQTAVVALLKNVLLAPHPEYSRYNTSEDNPSD